MEVDEEQAKRIMPLQKTTKTKQAVEVLQDTIKFESHEKAVEEQLQALLRQVEAMQAGIQAECEAQGGKAYAKGAKGKGGGKGKGKEDAKNRGDRPAELLLRDVRIKM